MILLKCSTSDGKELAVPFYQFNYSPYESGGYNASTYPTVDLPYYQRIGFNQLLKTGLQRSGSITPESTNIFLESEDGSISTSYFRVYRNGQGDDYFRLTFYASDTPDGAPEPYPDYYIDFYNPNAEGFDYRYDQSYQYSEGVRLLSDGTNAWRSFVLYEYKVKQGEGSWSVANRVAFYDPNAMVFMTLAVGGVQPHYQTVATKVQHCKRSKLEGIHVFALNDNYDPNEEGSTSGPGGGDPDPDFDDGDQRFPLDPPSAVDTGFVTLYNPSLAQLRQLSSFMWSQDLIDSFIRAMADPMDAILGLSYVPVAVPNGGTRQVRIGNVNSEISMTVAASQFVTLDCGAITLPKKWDSYLDYSPYTRATIWLPYIGYRELDIDEIVGKPLQLRYKIDILSGSCIAFLSTHLESGQCFIHQYEGNCARQVPITSSNWANVYSSLISVGTSIATMAAMPSAGTAIAGLSNTASQVMNMKPRIERSGSVTGSGSQMALQIPFILIERPNRSLAQNYKSFVGYPSNITRRLGDITGYTEVEQIHLEGINATESELSEIESLLKGGVIL